MPAAPHKLCERAKTALDKEDYDEVDDCLQLLYDGSKTTGGKEMILEVCRLLSAKSFLKEGTVIARDVDPSLSARHRRGRALRSLSDAGYFFQSFITYYLSDDVRIDVLCTGLCKLLLAIPRCTTPLYRGLSQIFDEPCVRTAFANITQSRRSLSALADMKDGFRLLQIILIQDDYPLLVMEAVEQLQRVILATFSIRQLCGPFVAFRW